jgi:YidC/Oxa1 family membrane protein insertase
MVALAICALLWVVFDLVLPKPEPPPEDQADVEALAEGETEGGKDGKADGDTKASDSADRPEEDDADEDEGTEAAPSFETVEHEIQTELLGLTLTNRSPGRGGLVSGIHLRSEQFAEHDTARNAMGLDGAQTLEISFSDAETDFRIPASTAYEVREASSTHVELGHQDDDVEVTERVEMLEGYEARLRVRVTNRSSKSQAHRLHVRTRIGLGEESRYDVQRGLCRLPDGLENEDRGDVDEEEVSYKGSIKWGGVDRKYFGSLVVPEHPFAECTVSLSGNQSFLENDLRSELITLEPGETKDYVFGLFIGPKELERLAAFEAVEVEPEGDLQEAIDWGILGSVSEFLGRLLLSMLRFFHGVTGAWGWSIVLLTICVKLITLPLTLKQMASMKAMKRIQPEIAKIKEKYGDDRVKQGQEMQALFARSGVNPLAGCFPLVVQMPVWFALYSMLGSAVELVHVNFLWLPDLTKQDPYYALPIALGAMMVLQNRMMPSTGDAAQAKMMRWVMPVVFSAFMLFLPSGLGVYIFVNIVLSVIQTAVQVGRSGDEKKAEASSSSAK